MRGRHLSARHAASCHEGVVRVVGVVDAAGLVDLGVYAWREARRLRRRRGGVERAAMRRHPDLVNFAQAEELRFRLISEKCTEDLGLPLAAWRQLRVGNAARFVSSLSFMHVVHRSPCRTRPRRSRAPRWYVPSGIALARAAARVDRGHGADGGGGEAREEQRARAAQHRRVRWRLQALGEQQHRQHSGPVTARKKGKPQSLVCARYVLALKDWVCTPAPRMSCIKLGVACRLVCYRSLANRRRAAWLAPLWRTR